MGSRRDDVEGPVGWRWRVLALANGSHVFAMMMGDKGTRAGCAMQLARDGREGRGRGDDALGFRDVPQPRPSTGCVEEVVSSLWMGSGIFMYVPRQVKKAEMDGRCKMQDAPARTAAAKAPSHWAEC